MKSTVLSFVGKQDPFSPKTDEEGSIVSLIKHLVEVENRHIDRVFLLYTQATRDGAELTQDWLQDYVEGLDNSRIERIAVDDGLSDDPVELNFATQAARQALERAKVEGDADTRLEFNVSSGTPVMKSAWGILQAAGYAPNSLVWQVRDPRFIREGQQRVFATDMTALKNEFDLNTVRRQLERYNYGGVLATLQDNSLLTDRLQQLLECAQYRLAFDFNRAFDRANQLRDRLSPDWIRDLSALRQNNRRALLREIYFKAQVRLNTEEYSDFLILLFAFEESTLKYLMLRQFLGNDRANEDWKYIQAKVWTVMERYDDGKLYQFLKGHRLEKGKSLRLNGDFNRLIMLAVLEYFAPLEAQVKQLLDPLKAIDSYAPLRNGYVHDLKGVSKLDNADVAIANVRKVVKLLAKSDSNPFDELNQIVREQLYSSPQTHA